MSKSATSTGISFGGLLMILFIALKLTNVIDWSWFWVLCPITIPLTIAGIIAVGALIMAAIAKKLK